RASRKIPNVCKQRLVGTRFGARAQQGWTAFSPPGAKGSKLRTSNAPSLCATSRSGALSKFMGAASCKAISGLRSQKLGQTQDASLTFKNLTMLARNCRDYVPRKIVPPVDGGGLRAPINLGGEAFVAMDQQGRLGIDAVREAPFQQDQQQRPAS